MRACRTLKRIRKLLKGHENLSILDRRIAQAVSNLKKRPAKKRLHRFAKELLSAHSYRLDLTVLERAMIRFQDEIPFDNADFFALNDTIVWEMAQSLSKGNFSYIDHCVATLRFLEQYDFDAFFAKHSFTERVLNCAPNGIFAKSNDATKAAYRAQVARYAKKHRITEYEAAKRLAGQLTLQVDHPIAKRLYFPLLCSFTLLLSFLSALLSRQIFVFFLLLLPIYAIVKIIVDRIYGAILSPAQLPSYQISELPQDASTLIVITSLLFGPTQDAPLFARLERFWLQNPLENAMYGILADFCDSDCAVSNQDHEILQNARAEIEALNKKYGHHFCLLIRRRTYNESEKRFMGYERKRGAVLELSRACVGEKNSFYAEDLPSEFLKKVRYLITLDADTELFIGAVCALVGYMLHPENRPIVENGIVRRGHAVLQPRMEPSLLSSSTTPFRVLQCGVGGMDVYSGASFDLYQTVFSEGIFCGKGIIDLNVYRQVLDNAFPENTVLSHDLLEGAFLGAGNITNLSLCDTQPKTPLADFARMHRWMRGDTQSLAFAFPHCKRQDNEKIKNPISRLSRIKLWDNLRRIFTPILQLTALIIGIFCDHRTAMVLYGVALLPNIVPFLFSVFDSAKLANRRFFSRVLPSIWQSFLLSLYQIMILPTLAIISIDALLRGLFRMLISRKRLLEWVTAGESDRNAKGYTAYLIKFLPETLLGLAMILFTPYGGYRILGALWYLSSWIAYCISLPYQKNAQVLSQSERQALLRYAKDMWQYFSDFANEENHHLPPDNYQILPTEALAQRTSPTNIGLYLLCVLCAKDFGFISHDEMRIRLQNTLSYVEELPHWHGHLYNWYDTKTLELLGIPYISTVDSGNFVTALVALCEGLKETKAVDLQELIAKCEILIARADFSKLYDAKRKLFYIGYDCAKESYGDNHYDLYMSEARTTSYYAIASGAVSKEHWQQLSRTLISKNHFLGLLSWSGTMFEYFMPSLLLPIYPDSLQSEALHFAYAMQVSAHTNRLWGRSESAYFHFDADMNYQYRAFGVQRLAMKSDLDKENVIAPYASFLALPLSYSIPLANLKHIEELGAYGKYGFYEAIDFTPSRVGGGHAVIRSFMAHHIGMSMIACANATFDHLFVRRFLKNPAMSAASELLMEKVPVDTPIYRPVLKNPPTPPQPQTHFLPKAEAENTAGELPTFALLSNGRARFTATSGGEIDFACGDIQLNRSNLITQDPYFGFRFFVRCDDENYNVLDSAFSDLGNAVVYDFNRDRAHLQTSFSILGEICCFCIHLEAEGEFHSITPTLLFEPIMTRQKDYDAHPAFSKLSIECEYDDDRNILFFHRRPRQEHESDCYLALTMQKNTPFDFSSQRDALLPLCYEVEDLAHLTQLHFAKEVGACVDPICAVKKTSQTEKGRYAADWLLLFSHQKEEICEWVASLRQAKNLPVFRLAQKAVTPIVRTLYSASGLEESQYRYVRLILCALYHPMPSKPLTKNVSIHDLWKFGISGDVPIVTLCIRADLGEGGNLQNIVRGFLRAQRYLAFCGIRFDLVFLCEESDPYSSARQNAILQLVATCGSELFLNRRGGIFLLSLYDAPQYLFARQCFYADLDAFCVFDHLFYHYKEVTPKHKEWTPHTKVHLPFSADCAFGREDGAVMGGALLRDRVIVYKGTQRAPWSYLYANELFGTQITQNSLGYTWWQNAREGRLTPFSNDPLRDFTGERLLYLHNGAWYDLCAVSNRVEFFHGFARYSGQVHELPFTVDVGVDAELQVKLIRCNIAHPERLRLETDIILGVTKEDEKTVISEEQNETIFYRNLGSEFFSDAVAYKIRREKNEKTMFLLGIYRQSQASFFDIVWEKYQTWESFDAAFSRYAQNANQLLSRITVETDDPLFDRTVNFYLPYQAIYVRLFGRSGFYQSGGAFGFRDQLQDSLAALFCDASLTKKQILLAASRQYHEGDVMHWWHETPYLRGIRSRCSDDLLWLPYVCAIYAETTQDQSIWETQVPYVVSEPLRDEEQERYEIPRFSPFCESIYQHCIRAIERACRFGRHNLPFIGSGDWNDGMNKIGEKGQGESVWLAFFLQMVLQKMIPVCISKGDDAHADLFRAIIRMLKENIERYCYDDDHYLRAFFDDGSAIGASKNDICAIDLLPQAFSAIVDGDSERAKTAVQTAFSKLYLPKGQLIRLFTPGVPSDCRAYGYISGYAQGLRENSGQYTHAAVWLAWAFYRIGDKSRAFEILKMLNPALRVKNDTENIYRTEPYALCGDVYAAQGHIGRGGWSQYTGSAAWYYRIFLTETLGYCEKGNTFTISPALCKALPRVKITLRHYDTVYVISAHMGEKNAVFLDGKEATFPMLFDKKSHFLEIMVENSDEMM